MTHSEPSDTEVHSFLKKKPSRPHFKQQSNNHVTHGSANFRDISNDTLHERTLPFRYRTSKTAEI